MLPPFPLPPCQPADLQSALSSFWFDFYISQPLACSVVSAGVSGLFPGVSLSRAVLCTEVTRRCSGQMLHKHNHGARGVLRWAVLTRSTAAFASASFIARRGPFIYKLSGFTCVDFPPRCTACDFCWQLPGFSQSQSIPRRAAVCSDFLTNPTPL